MITTGLKVLDSYLKGGIRPGTITDVFGANGTGKTSLVMQISINFLFQGKNILYQDTTGEFRPERLLEILKERNLEANLLDRIKVARITNTADQIHLLSKINNLNDFSLIIIDNVTDLFSFEY